MESRSIHFSIRFTEQEYGQIQKEAARRRITTANYVREKLFEPNKRLPPETDRLLKKLETDNIRIGTNINQVVRSCNAKQFITRMDYKALTELLAEMNRLYWENLEQLRNMQS